MLQLHLVSVILFLCSVSSEEVSDLHLPCGTTFVPPDPDVDSNTEKRYVGIPKSQKNSNDKTSEVQKKPKVIKVPVNVTIIQGGGTNVDRLNYESPNEWIKRLNETFKNDNIFFHLQNTTILKNKKVSQEYNSDKNEPKLIQKGQPTVLQVIVAENVGSNGNRYAGVSNYPWDKDNGFDAIRITAKNLLPNSASLIHEVGHWFGLFHTLHFGCPTIHKNHEGDYVGDTTLGQHANFKELKGDCKSLDILDKYKCFPLNKKKLDPYPVYNIMSYTPDRCRNTFTVGQISRMRDMYSWRNSNVKGPVYSTLY
jgi:hypothetical protein